MDEDEDSGKRKHMRRAWSTGRKRYGRDRAGAESAS
jgi:hypothetical protein